MIKLIVYILFLLVTALIYYGVHKLIKKMAYPKSMRFLHCRFLASYIVFVLLLFNRYTYSYWLLLIDKIMNNNALQSFWNAVLPMRSYELVYLIGILLFSNLFLLLGAVLLFTIVKFIFRRKTNFIDTRDLDMATKFLHFPWCVTNSVYTFDEDEERYCVTARGFTMSLWAGRMKYVFLLLGIVEIIAVSAAIYVLGEEGVAAWVNYIQGWYMLPVAAFLLFEQIQYYLEGNIDYEAGTYGSEDITLHLVGNMETLMHLYCKEFEGTDALLSAYGWKNMKVYKDGLINNGLNQNQIITCDQPEILEMINNQLREAHISQNTAYQNAISSLLNNCSINVRDYIQGEFLFYLASYMNFFISQEKTFLILCKNTTEAKEIQKELERVFCVLNKIYSIWKIADAEEADSGAEMSILVCSYDEFLKHNLLPKRAKFFKHLSAVVLCNGVEFCAQGNVQKEMFFSELSKIKHDFQYILLSRIDSDSLRNAFEYYTNKELIPYKNDQLQNNMYLMLWADDGIYKIQQAQGIGSIQSPYLGVSIPLALLAAKYDMPRIKVFAEPDKGYYTYHDAMTMSYQEIVKYLRSSLDLNKMIMFNSFSLLDNLDMEVLILNDSEYNLFNTLWAWMKYGGKSATMVHVISPPYMLREYFAANLKELILRNNDFDAFISYRSGLKHTRFLALLLQLSNAGVDEEELMKKNQEYGWGYPNVMQLLSDCLKDVLNSNEFYNIFECFRFEEKNIFDEEKDGYVHKTKVFLADENIRMRIHQELDFAKLVSKNNVVYNLPVLKGNIYNSYLRGQIMSFGGYMCRVSNISDGMVFVEQTMPSDKMDYLQASEFVFKNMKKIDECVDMDILDFNIYSADIERKIYGYWASAQEVAFQKDGALRFYETMDLEDKPITVAQRKIQVLQMKMKKSVFGEKEKEAQLLMAFMLKELFKTLYPTNHNDMFAVIEYDREDDYWSDLFKDSDSVSLEHKVRSIVPFAKHIAAEKTDSDYFSIYAVEFSSLEMGMLSSMYANRMKVFQMMASYLEWYLGDNTIEEDSVGRKNKATYLNLGGEEIASCFAAQEVLDFCKRLLPKYEKIERAEITEDDFDKEYICSFCGKPSLFTYSMDDQRKMCRSCKEQQIEQKDEIKRLYLETVEFLNKGYRIKFRKNIHLRFKSAEAIRTRCQVSGGGRILGFYNSKNHELWIEARGPKNAVRATIIHELTHAWQFANLDTKKLQQKCKDNNEYLMYLEGHASYMEVDAMRKIGEDEYSNYLETRLMARQDEYGAGYRMLKKYLESKEQEGSFWTPYKAMEELINNM